MFDGEVAKRVQEGDKEAFGKLMERYQRKLTTVFAYGTAVMVAVRRCSEQPTMTTHHEAIAMGVRIGKMMSSYLTG